MNGRSPLGVGIIGCGYWGGNYVRVFDELPGAYVAGVCDARPERLQHIRQRFPEIFVCTDPGELLSRADIRAIVVCTEATTHYSIAHRCLRAGKHLLVEKPLTTRVSEAAELTDLAEHSGVTLMVAHTFIYNTGVRKLRDYVNPPLGQVYYMHAHRTNLGPVRRDVNAIWDLATHDISIFNYLLDSTPVWVSAVASRVLGNGREDIGFITLSYPGGVLGHIHVSWADPNKAREVVVVCSDKRIVFNDLNGLERIRVFEKGIRTVPAEPAGYGEHHLQIHDGDIISPRVEVSEPLKDQCRHFLECVQSGRKPVSGGREAVDVLRVLAAIDRSVMLCGAQIEVEKNGECSQTTAA
jgi:predicted dehydrogenase